jgi:hypothetical protein
MLSINYSAGFQNWRFKYDHPNRSPISMSYSTGSAGGGASTFLGYSFLASFLGSSFLVSYFLDWAAGALDRLSTYLTLYLNY